MAEKEKEKDKSESEGKKQITHKITVMNDTLEVTAPKGTSLQDLLKQFFEEHPDKNLSFADLTIVYNGIPIEVRNGHLTQNPILLEGSIIGLFGRFKGGN